MQRRAARGLFSRPFTPEKIQRLRQGFRGWPERTGFSPNGGLGNGRFSARLSLANPQTELQCYRDFETIVFTCDMEKKRTNPDFVSIGEGFGLAQRHDPSVQRS